MSVAMLVHCAQRIAPAHAAPHVPCNKKDRPATTCRMSSDGRAAGTLLAINHARQAIQKAEATKIAVHRSSPIMTEKCVDLLLRY